MLGEWHNGISELADANQQKWSHFPEWPSCWGDTCQDQLAKGKPLLTPIMPKKLEGQPGLLLFQQKKSPSTPL